jgi:hypothetical protein
MAAVFDRIEVKLAEGGKYDLLFRGRNSAFQTVFAVARNVDRADLPGFTQEIVEAFESDPDTMWANRKDVSKIVKARQSERINRKGA